MHCQPSHTVTVPCHSQSCCQNSHIVSCHGSMSQLSNCHSSCFHILFSGITSAGEEAEVPVRAAGSQERASSTQAHWLVQTTEVLRLLVSKKQHMHTLLNCVYMREFWEKQALYQSLDLILLPTLPSQTLLNPPTLPSQSPHLALSNPPQSPTLPSQTLLNPPPCPLKPSSIPPPCPLKPSSIPPPCPLKPSSIPPTLPSQTLLNPLPCPLKPSSIPPPCPLKPSSIPPPCPLEPPFPRPFVFPTSFHPNPPPYFTPSSPLSLPPLPSSSFPSPQRMQSRRRSL